MLQRFFAFFAIVGLLASQLASLPHAHEGMTAAEQQNHAAKPHFHTGSHGHHHGGHFHHHHAPEKQSADQETSEPLSESCVVYCSPEVDVVLISKTMSYDGNQGSCQWVEVVDSISLGANHISRLWHPPDADWQDSHLYLSLRNLRI